jgi:hypothetical protein
MTPLEEGSAPSEIPLLDNTRQLQQTDIHETWRDSNPQSLKASGRRPTHYDAAHRIIPYAVSTT